MGPCGGGRGQGTDQHRNMGGGAFRIGEGHGRNCWKCFCLKITSVQGGNLAFWCLGVHLPQFAHWIMAKENPCPDCNWSNPALCQNRGGERPISIHIQRPAQPSPAKDCLEYRWATFPPPPPGAFQGTQLAAGTPKLPRKDYGATIPQAYWQVQPDTNIQMTALSNHQSRNENTKVLQRGPYYFSGGALEEIGKARILIMLRPTVCRS